MSSDELQTATKFEISERIEVVLVAAWWAVIGSSSYMRGLMDGSPMTAAEFSEYAAANGPYWPLALFAVGMVVLAATFSILLWRYHNG